MKQKILVGTEQHSTTFRFPGEFVAGDTHEQNIRRGKFLHRRTLEMAVYSVATGGFLMFRGWREIGGGWVRPKPESFASLSQICNCLWLEDQKKVGPWAWFRKQLVALSVTT